MILFLRNLLIGKLAWIGAFLCLLPFVPAPEVEAGNWRVAPVKVYFDARTRSEVVTVTNDGAQPLALEISAVEWTQGPDGQDVYQPASDLVFFPKQLTIEPKLERVIRTGVKVPAVGREKTYRLFIKEVPDRSQLAPNAVAIAVQFGVPIFAKPVQEDIAGAISAARIVDNTFSSRIDNLGNSHFRIGAITLQGSSATGEPLFQQELSGWYLLAGSSRPVSAAIPLDICRQLETLDIQVNADRINFNGRIDVDQTMCAAP